MCVAGEPSARSLRKKNGTIINRLCAEKNQREKLMEGASLKQLKLIRSLVYSATSSRTWHLESARIHIKNNGNGSVFAKEIIESSVIRFQDEIKDLNDYQKMLNLKIDEFESIDENLSWFS